MEYTTLDKISENLDSKRKPITSSDREEGSIPYYGASGIVDYVKDYIFDESLLLVSEDGANLLARSTPIAFSVSGKTWINNHAHVLRFSNQKLQKYVEIYLNSISLESYVTGSAQPKLNQKMLNEIPIPITDDLQIDLVVDSIDKIRKIFEQRKQELVCLDDLIKARFVELFGDCKNMISMSELCSIITDGTHQPPKFQDTGIPFIFVSNLANNIVTYNAEKFISEETYNELYKRTPIEQGDLLLSTVGSYGHPAVVIENKKFLFQRHIAYLKPKKEIINSFYMHSALLAPDCQRQIEGKVKGIAQKTLNLSEIKKIMIPVPNIKEQNQFADFVNQVDKSKVVVM